MAWPLTPIQTFISNVTRWTAAWANQVQAGVNGIVAGTYSLIGVVADGVGGQTITAVPGTLQAAAAAGGTSTPTPSITKQALYRDLVPIAVAAVSAAGALVWGVNIASVIRASAGHFTVTLTNGASSAAKMVPIATSQGLSGADPAQADVTNATTIEVYAGQGGNSNAFFLVVWGD